MKLQLFAIAVAAGFEGSYATGNKSFKGTVLLKDGDEIFTGCNCRDDWLFKEKNIYLQQRNNGNLEVRRGKPSDSELVWSSDINLPEGEYWTRLQRDGNLCTRKGMDKSGKKVWKTKTPFKANKDYFFGLTDDMMFVEVWRGKPSKPRRLLTSIRTLIPRYDIKWTKLLPDDGAPSDQFGLSVSISGKYAIIGASEYGGWENRDGSAYVFSHSGKSWTQQTKLLPEDNSYDGFGQSVAIDRDTAIVGANGYFKYAAYVFVRSGDEWAQQGKLTPKDDAEGTTFGHSVAIGGDTAVVGAPYGGSGSVYVFKRSGKSWTQQDKLVQIDAIWGDEFGISVAIHEDTIIVGAEGDARSNIDAPGAAYIFTRSSGDKWTQQANLVPSDGREDDAFGCSVAIDGTTAVVGARHHKHKGKTTGSAYVFEKVGSTWTQQAELMPSDGTEEGHYDFFGQSTAIKGDTIVVGAPQDGNTNGIVSGSAYVFTRSDGTWTQQDKIFPTGALPFARFGTSAALDDTSTGVIGARDRSENGSRSGSAYVIGLH